MSERPCMQPLKLRRFTLMPEDDPGGAIPTEPTPEEISPITGKSYPNKEVDRGLVIAALNYLIYGRAPNVGLAIDALHRALGDDPRTH